MSSHSSSRTIRFPFFRRRTSWVVLFLVRAAGLRMLSPRVGGVVPAFTAAFSTPAALRWVVTTTGRTRARGGLLLGFHNTQSATTTRALTKRISIPAKDQSSFPNRNRDKIPFESLLFWQRRRWITKTSLMLSSSSSSSSSSFQEGDFIAKQKQISQEQGRNNSTLSSSSSQPQPQLNSSNDSSHHLEHQRRVFDALADTFAAGETLSDELMPVYEQLAQRILSHYTSYQQNSEATTTTTTPVVDEPNPSSSDLENAEDDATKTTTATMTTIRILDVACGTGALWPFLVQAATASDQKYRLEVTGVDLSGRMVQRAQEHAQVLQQQQPQQRHSFTVVETDILRYPPQPEPFDLVIANACFANFWDPVPVLEHLAQLLRPNGTLLVTHPLGSAFVARLHQQDPSTVPRTLPPSRRAWVDLTTTLPWRLLELINGSDAAASSSGFYFAALRRVRARALSTVMKLRGEVDTGYGRGGKQLGFPTANLPSRLFQNALQNITPGVYFGWALLEDNNNNDNNKRKVGRNVAHKAVVNVGFSPTFEGQENVEKIVEAHLIFDKDENDNDINKQSPLDPPDFYHETMRLQLIGFLRPEIKFPSFPALIAQIRQDVREAQVALDDDPYRELARDDFLRVQGEDHDDTGTTAATTATWVGSSGGNAMASWEFQNIKVALENVRAKESC